jgi:hypothetical protein
MPMTVEEHTRVKRATRLVGAETVMIYERAAAPAADVMKLRARTGLIRIGKAIRALAYQPSVSRTQALLVTLDCISEGKVR